MALSPVQRQLQAPIQETLNAGDRPRASSLTAHIDVRIVCITHEPMASPLQFAVEFVEQDVATARAGRLAASLLAVG